MRTTNARQKAKCLLLKMLPLELRLQIYHLLLTIVSPLDRAGDWVRDRTGKPNSITFKGLAPEKRVLHANILRTCRTIYTETLPTLYGANTFSFIHPWDLHSFREDRLIMKRCKRMSSPTNTIGGNWWQIGQLALTSNCSDERPIHFGPKLQPADST